MADALDEKGILIQNLQDAGCDRALTEQCIELAAGGRLAGVVSLLQTYRMALLSEIHCGQDKLDCLDYLIYRLEKEKKKKLQTKQKTADQEESCKQRKTKQNRTGEI